MKIRALTAPETTSAFIVFAPGEEVLSTLTEWATANNITAASFSAIGAFRDAELGFLNLKTNAFEHFKITENAEILSLNGNIAIDDKGKVVVHAHTALGLSDTSSRGGHLVRGHVYPTLEMTCIIWKTTLVRQPDEQTGIEPIKL